MCSSDLPTSVWFCLLFFHSIINKLETTLLIFGGKMAAEEQGLQMVTIILAVLAIVATIVAGTVDTNI